jgi:ribosomal protein L18
MAKLTQTERRRARVRKQLKDRSSERPRLSIFRSDKNIYAQIIDDQKGVTLVAASSVEKELKSRPKSQRHRMLAGSWRNEPKRPGSSMWFSIGAATAITGA